MQKFTEFLNEYKAWKRANHPTEKFDEYDMAYVRECYSAQVKASNDAKKLLEARRARRARLANRSARLARNASIRESSRKPETAFQKALKAFAAFKESKGYGPVTREERLKIFERTRSNRSRVVESKITVKGVFDKLNESKKCVALAQKRLTEGDVMGAADATMAAGNAVNGAEADANAMATPTAPVPQEVVDQISQVKSAVDALAASAGIASPVDTGSDPNAGVPAVTGAPEDTTTQGQGNAGAAPVTESSKSRLAASKARINEAKDDSKPGVVVPPLNDLIKGTVTGASKEAAPADTWPTKPLKEVPVGKKLGNVKESDEFAPDKEDGQEQITEKTDTPETKGMAEQILESELAKKNFNWSDFLKSGFNKK